MTQEAGQVVVVSDSDAACRIAARLERQTGAVRSMSMQELMNRAEQLDDVGVLVLDSGPHINGLLLVAMGRMKLDRPALQTVALVDGEPPLSVASYLTSCGVDLVCKRSGEEALDELATVVNRMQQRAKWLVSQPHATVVQPGDRT